ncbi:GNAT family N-acetyltransferase [Nocardia sp. NPDC005366]|uniref:GNAT family N-acetyltransferase n=1 Tax=Nocardia sp. NPDC005366 TaxID=3156878 RepID=UPI0033A6630D
MSAQITFRPVVPGDFPLLARWLSNPHVARWWNHEFSPEAVERHFGPTTRGEEPAEELLACASGISFALVQRFRWHDYPEASQPLSAYLDIEETAMTIDYLIGNPARVGRGCGTALIGAIVTDTWITHPSTNTIIVPVSAGNTPSWRVLEKNGFIRVIEADLEPDNPIDPPLHYVYRLGRESSGLTMPRESEDFR